MTFGEFLKDTLSESAEIHAVDVLPSDEGITSVMVDYDPCDGQGLVRIMLMSIAEVRIGDI